MAKSIKPTKFDKRLETLAVKTRMQKEALLDQLVRYPIIQAACERAGVGRSTYYDWVNEDEEFAQKAKMALNQGSGFVNDMAESMLIKNIQGGNNTSIIFWLKNHHKGYNERVIHDHRFSVGVSEKMEHVFTDDEISAVSRAFNNCGYANVLKFNSKGYPEIDVDAVERELPEAEKIIAPEIAQQEKEAREYRHKIDTKIYGLSKEEHEKKERKIEEKRAEEKRCESINLKEFFRKHHESEKLKKEAEEKPSIGKKESVFSLKEYEKNKAEKEKTGTKKKRGAFNLKKYLKKKAEKEKQG